ncbi:MAG: hypothetical protein JF886_02070 [Candidatus Dormibacteraeota bacterium]|uniref:Uncharacterized protein n=1 Tax=Candidatus Aeolococcus gillhamiae TaxID=3127015 RepID=A0A934JY24_9BACT|nr:hypothetical protein [Candidatus Dormibacteraeota bacterium]
MDPAVSPKHPGTAFMELQFYPPGWVKWPAAAVAGGTSCDATKWCIALNIDSLSEDPVTGKTLNDTCTAAIGGNIEYINFAFLTKNGKSFAPANPIQATPATTLTPDPQKTFFMNSGDRISVTLHDTEHGLRTQVNDLTPGESGSMTSSAANGFGMIKYAPTRQPSARTSLTTSTRCTAPRRSRPA